MERVAMLQEQENERLGNDRKTLAEQEGLPASEKHATYK